jgi:phosphatidylserine/phosphatidylglycerophosphate/cardiolipin synthase-like enzyme
MTPTRSSSIVPGPADRRKAVIDAIRSTERDLILSIYRCDDFQIIDEVAAAVGRGVAVRILVTRHAKGWDKRLKGVVTLLSSAGAQVYRYQGPFEKYHAKYLVSDGATALVATFNLTVKCFTETCDFLLETQDAGIVQGLTALFEFDCNLPDGALPLITDRLIIGPQQTRPRLMELLAEAHESICIIDDRVTDREILDLLESKMRSGVDVRILRRGDLRGMTSHGRMMIVDNRRAVIGSVALSTVSLDSRREVAAVIEQADCVEQLRGFFESFVTHAMQPLVIAANAAGNHDASDEDE